MAAKLAALRADSLYIGGVDKVRSFGMDRKRSFDQAEPPLEIDLVSRDDSYLTRTIESLLNDDDSDDCGLAECSTKSVKEIVRPSAPPKLVRGYSIGTMGSKHLGYDIHAKHQLDLHDALIHSTKKLAQEEAINTPDAFLRKLVSERRPQSPTSLPFALPATAASNLKPPPPVKGVSFAIPAALPVSPASPDRNHAQAVDQEPKVDSTVGKAWAIMRQAAMAASILKLLKAAKEAGSLDEKSEASLTELSQKLQPPAGADLAGIVGQLPTAFDVPEWVEQAFMAQAQAGELGELYATIANAYLPQQATPTVDPAQIYLMRAALEQQQQQYLLQLQAQQQQQMQMQRQVQQMQQQLQQQEQLRQQQLYQEQLRQQQMQMQMQMQMQQGFSPPPLYGGAPVAPQQPGAMPPMRSPPHSPPATMAAAAGTTQPIALGQLVEAAYTKEGSQTLQHQLHSIPPELLQQACAKLAPHIGDLSFDTFGNYLISSMAKLQKAQPTIVAALRGRVVDLATHAQGSRVLQAVLEAVPASVADGLVAELKGYVVEVASKTYGSWSVCTAYKATHADFVLDEIAGSVGVLSVKQDGSRVVQRVLPEATGHGMDISVVLDALIALGNDLGRLATDPFGNYVVQAALRLVDGDADRKHRLVTLLLPYLPVLSTSKTGSNVAEVLLACLDTNMLLEARRLLTQDAAYDLGSHRYGTHVMATLRRRIAVLGC